MRSAESRLWFRNDGSDTLLETFTYFEDRLPRRGAQIVLKGLIATVGARVRWKFTPVDPADPHSGARAALPEAPTDR